MVIFIDSHIAINVRTTRKSSISDHCFIPWPVSFCVGSDTVWSSFQVVEDYFLIILVYTLIISLQLDCMILIISPFKNSILAQFYSVISNMSGFTKTISYLYFNCVPVIGFDPLLQVLSYFISIRSKKISAHQTVFKLSTY